MAHDPTRALTDPSFRRLWTATLLAQGGSALGSVGIPLVAITVLGMSSSTVALMATSSAVVLVVAALPGGHFAEFHRKRPIMVGTDLVRAAVFGALGALLLTGLLRVEWMFIALGVNAATQTLFQSASSAYIKSLLAPEARADGMGKLQAAIWGALIVGPMLAGVLAAAVSPAALLLGNAATFLLSALLISRITRPDEAPARRAGDRRRLAEALAGARFLVRDPLLRRLFVAWLLFAGAVAALTPLTQVLTLDELGFSSAQYGLLMGVPSVGGFLGAWLAGPVARRWGAGRTTVWASAARLPFYCLYPLATAGTTGLVILLIAFTGVLVFSAIANSAIGAIRMEATPDDLMSRSSAAWSLATMVAGPVLIPVLGLLAGMTSARTALWGVVALVAFSLLALPARALIHRDGGSAASGPAGGRPPQLD